MALTLTQNHVEVGISVTDFPQSQKFYAALGFAEVAAMPLGWGGTLHILKLGDAVIKLAENDENPEESNPPGGPTGALGIRWITLWISDVDDAVKIGAEAGGTVAVPVNADYPGVKFAMLADPDGNWLELVESTAD